jgi:hypothetical protein
MPKSRLVMAKGMEGNSNRNRIATCHACRTSKVKCERNSESDACKRCMRKKFACKSLYAGPISLASRLNMMEQIITHYFPKTDVYDMKQLQELHKRITKPTPVSAVGSTTDDSTPRDHVKPLKTLITIETDHRESNAKTTSIKDVYGPVHTWCEDNTVLGTIQPPSTSLFGLVQQTKNSMPYTREPNNFFLLPGADFQGSEQAYGQSRNHYLSGYPISKMYDPHCTSNMSVSSSIQPYPLTTFSGPSSRNNFPTYHHQQLR